MRKINCCVSKREIRGRARREEAKQVKKEMKRLRAVVVVMVVVVVLRVTCQRNGCPAGYKPFDCTTCVHITEEELTYTSSESICPMSGVLLQLNNVPNETLQRYLEVYKAERVWTGYTTNHSGHVIIPDSNELLDVRVVKNECNINCCVAWQFNPFGVVITDCDKPLRSICTSNSDSSIIDSSGFGESTPVAVNIGDESQPEGSRHYVSFGTPVTLNCSQDDIANVLWYINDNLVTGTSGNSTLTIEFHQPGIYTCQVTTSVGVGSENRSVLLCGIDAEPGIVDSVDVYPNSQTEVTVEWKPPTTIGTIDPLLLRYTVYYSSQSVLDSDSEVVTVLPQVTSDGVTIQLNDLKHGTEYVIGVIASTTFTPDSSNLPTVKLVASTYGKAPTNSVSGLTLEETGGKSVKASWEEARLSLPEGPIARYQLEYRNGPDSLSNPAHVTPEQTFLTFYGIENADNFQVRVAILVVINETGHYEQSNWTDWVNIQPTGDVVSPTDRGEVRPTDSEGDDTDIIVASILVPLAVVVVLILLIVSSLCLYLHRRKKLNSYQVSKDVVLEDTIHKV